MSWSLGTLEIKGSVPRKVEDGSKPQSSLPGNSPAGHRAVSREPLWHLLTSPSYHVNQQLGPDPEEQSPPSHPEALREGSRYSLSADLICCHDNPGTFCSCHLKTITSHGRVGGGGSSRQTGPHLG